MGKKVRKGIATLKKHELLNKYQALPKCCQRAAAEQLNISRGCLRNLLREETALQTEASGKEGSNEPRDSAMARTEKWKMGCGNGSIFLSLARFQ